MAASALEFLVEPYEPTHARTVNELHPIRLGDARQSIPYHRFAIRRVVMDASHIQALWQDKPPDVSGESRTGCEGRAGRRARTPKAQTPPLGENTGAKGPEVPDIPSEQTPWLLYQPIKPLETGASHPNGCALQLASEKIDGCPYTHHHGNAERMIVHSDPFLLFRAAKGNQKDIRPGGDDSAPDILMVHFEQRTEGRRILARDFQTGVIRLQPIHCASGRFR